MLESTVIFLPRFHLMNTLCVGKFQTSKLTECWWLAGVHCPRLHLFESESYDSGKY
jgi:hypothetical protein